MARIEEHTVAAGETLWHITGKYYTDPSLNPELAKANGIANPDRLSPGQKIKLPTALYRANEVSFSPDQVTIDLGGSPGASATATNLKRIIRMTMRLLQ